MIAESLKRRHSGWDEPEQPPKKILCVHDNRQNQDPGNSRIVSKKRPLSVDISETDTENILAGDDRWIRLKRRRIKQETREVDSDGDAMQIKGSAQYHHSPAKTKTGKTKRNKKNKGQKGAANAHPEPEKVEDQAFNDMLFWRPLLPDIEAELAKFFEDSMEISETSANITSSSDEESIDEYSSFNFWRVPICDVDLSAIH